MTKTRALTAVCGLLLAAAVCAQGGEVTFREGGGKGFVGLTWDVVSINTTSGFDPSDPYANDSNWFSEAIPVSGDTTTDKYYVLLAIKDLLTTLPISSDDITSATLTLTASSGDNDSSVVAYRVKTDWLEYWDDAGANETNVTGYFRDLNCQCGWGGPWVFNAEVFSSSDYYDADAATGTWGVAYQQPLELDVTDQVKAMYAAGENYGWAVTNLDASDANITIYNPGGGGDKAFNPSLRIDFTSTGTYSLTVNNGSGSRSYEAGTLVEVTADAAPADSTFTGWIGDTLWVGDAAEAETTVVMPPYDINITATYGIPIIWIRQFGTDQEDNARGVSVDGAGNVFVGGETSGELVAGRHVGGQDIFVRKYTSSGEECWTDQLGSTQLDDRLGVSADANGNVYFCGRTTGDFASPRSGPEDIFMGKYDPSGELLWCNQFGTQYHDHGTRVVAGESGLVHISGCTQGDLYPGDGPEDPGGLHWNCYIATYDDSGALLWSDQIDDPGNNTVSECNGVSPDGLGNLYLTGSTDGDLTGQGGSSEGSQPFVRKYDAAGAPVWTDQFAAVRETFRFPDCATASVTDTAGNLYVAGNTSCSIDGQPFMGGRYDVYLRKYSHDTTTGTAEWTRLIGTGGTDMCIGSIAVDMFGNVCVGGYTWGSFGENSGSDDIFLAKYDSSGNMVGVVTQFGTSASDNGGSVATDQWGNIYIVGSTNGDMEGQNAGGSDAFIAKLGFSYTLTVNSGSGDGQYPGGTVVNIQADAAATSPSCRFLAWTGDTADVADVNSAATTITMPAGDAEITARYTFKGDLDGDWFVGQDDLDIVLDQWGHGDPPHDPITDPRADASGDGFVGQDDLDIVLDQWGKSGEPDSAAPGGDGPLAGGGETSPAVASLFAAGGSAPLDSGTFSVAIVPLDNNVEDSTLEYYGIDLGADYVSQDIQITTDTDWLGAQLVVTPGTSGKIFQYPFGSYETQPSSPTPILFGGIPPFLPPMPGLEFDTFIGDGTLGNSVNALAAVDLGRNVIVFNADELAIAWCTTTKDQIGTFWLARVTLANDATGTWKFTVTASPAEGPKVLVEGTIVAGVLMPN